MRILHIIEVAEIQYDNMNATSRNSLPSGPLAAKTWLGCICLRKSRPVARWNDLAACSVAFLTKYTSRTLVLVVHDRHRSSEHETALTASMPHSKPLN